jgi:hypothetical protein
MKKPNEKVPEKKNTQSELEKLVEQKQKETKALITLMNVLEKIDTDKDKQA